MKVTIEKRPEGRSKEEQAKINQAINDDLTNRAKNVFQSLANFEKNLREQNRKIITGELAMVAKDSFPLVFNSNLTKVSYGKSSFIIKNNLQDNMLKALVKQHKRGLERSGANTPNRHRLIGIHTDTLQNLLGVGDDEAVENAYKRLNNKFYKEFGIKPIEVKERFYYINHQIRLK